MTQIDPRTTDEKLLIGASWYPEMWPEDEWPKDIARMNELGFNVVRVFEFAWHRMEPEEGKFDFDWARKLLDLCHEAGISVMLGTPSAAPPAWLTDRYPEVLQVRPDGTRRIHGMRKHGSHVSAKYRQMCGKIVRAMCENLADHPAVHSWQIDNEMGGRDYSDEAREKFHTWLENRYGSIENLNKTWGLEFWSQAYTSFDQIPMPTAAVGSIEVPERHHPSLIYAIARFNSDMWTEFIKHQCDIIREYTNKPITTNMCGAATGMNWPQNNRLLDRVGYSLYKDLDHYPWNLMYLDRMRGEKPDRPYWLLETAPNWSGGGKQWNIHHSPDGVKAMTWMCTLMGGSMTLYWQWRQHWAGQEMQHGTHVTATGKWRPNKEVWTELATAYREHGRWLLDNPPAEAKIGIVFSTEAAWAFSVDPIDDNMKYLDRWRDDYYQPLVKEHVWRDAIPEDADFSRYKVLLLPMMPIVKESTRERLKQWVADGGRLLLGPITGTRTEEFTVPREQEFNGLEELIGAESALRFTAHLQEDKVKVAFHDGSMTRTRNWCEGYDVTTGENVAHYEGGYGHGQVAVVRNQYGKGKVITLGCHMGPAAYMRMVRELMDDAGLRAVAGGSQQVLVVPRAGTDGKISGYGVVNMTEDPQTVILPSEGTDLLTGKSTVGTMNLNPLETRIVKI
ncbi:MAG: beta-galactosidase [Phycisphaerae bacterium]